MEMEFRLCGFLLSGWGFHSCVNHVVIERIKSRLSFLDDLFW